jgi:hypothetical protein
MKKARGKSTGSVLVPYELWYQVIIMITALVNVLLDQKRNTTVGYWLSDALLTKFRWIDISATYSFVGYCSLTMVTDPVS